LEELVVCYGSENCVGNFTNISNITISTNGSNATQNITISTNNSNATQNVSISTNGSNATQNVTISTNGSSVTNNITCLGNKCYNTLPLEKETIFCFTDAFGVSQECG